MTILLIIAAVAAAIYLYAAAAFYHGYKDWRPLCGCTGAACGMKKPSQAVR
jgi:hypothetical protein